MEMIIKVFLSTTQVRLKVWPETAKCIENDLFHFLSPLKKSSKLRVKSFQPPPNIQFHSNDLKLLCLFLSKHFFRNMITKDFHSRIVWQRKSSWALWWACKEDCCCFFKSNQREMEKLWQPILLTESKIRRSRKMTFVWPVADIASRKVQRTVLRLPWHIW